MYSPRSSAGPPERTLAEELQDRYQIGHWAEATSESGEKWTKRPKATNMSGGGLQGWPPPELALRHPGR